MDSLYVSVIAASLARDAERAALEDSQAPKERRGWGWLWPGLFAPPAAAPRAEPCEPAAAR